MPHIVVETTPDIGRSLDFQTLFLAIHRKIAAGGYAALADFKSRVLETDHHLAGEDASAQFLVVRLVTTNPRPKPIQLAMAQIIHDAFRDAIEREPRTYGWQCCVLIEPFEKQDYLKTSSQAPGRRVVASARGAKS